MNIVAHFLKNSCPTHTLTSQAFMWTTVLNSSSPSPPEKCILWTVMSVRQSIMCYVNEPNRGILTDQAGNNSKILKTALERIKAEIIKNLGLVLGSSLNPLSLNSLLACVGRFDVVLLNLDWTHWLIYGYYVHLLEIFYCLYCSLP